MLIGQTGIIAGSQTPLFLNLYENAVAAFSTRRLSKTYAGKALRVRRSSDDTEQDIGFTGNDLDTTSLLAFVGAGDGFVNTWYDQSVNGINLSQTTLSGQPQIVSGGTLITKNGKPAIEWISGATQYLEFTTNAFIASTPDIYTVMSIDSYGSGNTTAIFSRTSAGVFWAAKARGFTVQGGTAVSSIYSNDGVQRLLNLYVDTGDAKKVSINDSTGFTFVQTPTTIQGGSSTFDLGAIRATPEIGLIGHIQEFIVWTSNQSTNKAAIKSNISSYFSIPGDVSPRIPYSEIFGQNGGDVSAMNFPTKWIDAVGGTSVGTYPDWIVYGLNDVIPFCDVAGSSGGPFLIFANGVAGQTYTNLPSISTINNTDINISMNQYRMNGIATTTTLEYSFDNSNWSAATLNEVTDDDTWHAMTPTTLPSICNNQPLVFLRLGINSDGSGLLVAFDDILISGTTS